MSNTNKPTQHHSKNGTPLSMALCIIIDAAIAAGFECKPLALGMRLVGLDVVLADCWRGLYLCKSGGRGLSKTRNEAAGLSLRTADKGQFCISADLLATEQAQATEQARDMLAMGVKAGYVGLGPLVDKLSAAPSKRDKASKPSKPASEQASKANALDAALAASK
jgi:hypothetical protein